MNIKRKLSKLGTYVTLAATSLIGSISAEEFKVNENIDKKISVNFNYSQQYHPEAVDDWGVTVFKNTITNSISLNYNEREIPDNLQNLGWSSLEAKALDENAVTEILQSLKQSNLKYHDFITKAITFSPNQKRILLSSLGDLGSQAYGGKSNGQNNTLFLEKLQQKIDGEDIDVGLCGAIHKNLAGIFNDINGSQKISLIGGVGYDSLHGYMAELGSNGWNIINYGSIIFTKEKNLSRALLIADEQFGQFSATHKIYDESGKFLFLEITPDGKSYFNAIGKDPENGVFKNLFQISLPKNEVELNIGNYESSLSGDYRFDESDITSFIGGKITNIKGVNKTINNLNIFNLHFGTRSQSHKNPTYNNIVNLSVADIDLKEKDRLLIPFGCLFDFGYKPEFNQNRPLAILGGMDFNLDLPTLNEIISGSDEVNDAETTYFKTFVGAKYNIPTIGNEKLELLLLQEFSLFGTLINEPIVTPSKTTVGFDAHAFNGYCTFGGLLKLDYTGAGFKPSLNLDFERNGFNVALGGNILIPNEPLIIPATTNFNASVQVKILDNLNLKLESSITLDDKETAEAKLGLEYKF